MNGKIYFFLIILTALSFFLKAQDTVMVFDKNGYSSEIQKMNYYLTISGGMMMVIVDGNISPMKKSFSLENGAIIFIDGTVRLADGKTWKLKEGQRIFLKKKINQKLNG